MSSYFRCLILLFFVCVKCSTIQAEEQTPAQKPESQPATKSDQGANSANASPVDQAALEKKFSEDMSGVVFAGSFSVTRDGKEFPAEMEKYTITKTTKSKDDYWIFQVRIQYGKQDVKLPLTLQVKWAGDTPIITLTDLTIPGLGTFTSRVLIYGDRYAGTWQHGKVGGHLWGRLEKIENSRGPIKPDESEKPKDTKE